MDNTIKVGCPVCGSVLVVKDSPGNAYGELTCPVCKRKSPFVRFKRVADTVQATQYPDAAGESPLGSIVVRDTSVSFQLKEGRNVIGRQSKSSGADIQLPCTSKRMSREHIVIDAERVAGKGYVHYVSLNKEQVNPTYVNGQFLSYGDKIILNAGDIIRLPDMELKFCALRKQIKDKE